MASVSSTDGMKPIDRRSLLLAGASAALLAACSSDDASDDAEATTPDTLADPSSTEPVTESVVDAPVGSDAPIDVAVTDAAELDEPDPSEGDDATGLARLAAIDFESLGSCALTPEAAAGPFPLVEQFDRRDITEGYPGHPLRLGFRVLDDVCAPVPGAAVEVWHTDASGDYSAFIDDGDGKDEGPGTTFFRGTQTADDDGIVEFTTIYPGWYRGRTVHIHLRVHVDAETVLTSQVYFDDGYTAEIFTTGEYATFGPADTSNATDGLAGDPQGDGTLLSLSPGDTPNGVGTLALLNLSIP